MGIKLATDFVRPNENNESRMWKAVVGLAFEDCASVGAAKLDAYRKQDAHEWLLSESEDFQNVCFMANLDPLRVRNRYIELLETKKIKFTEIQREWLNYKDQYAMYRGTIDKKQRQRIMEQIVVIKKKLSGGS